MQLMNYHRYMVVYETMAMHYHSDYDLWESLTLT